MSEYPLFVKRKLTSIIKQMAKSPELFAKNPSRDFTRKRKLSFETLIQLLLCMGGGSLDNELLKYFSFDSMAPSSSAFVQQRDKLLPKALEYLLHRFNQSFEDFRSYKGYRLIAFDGSDLIIPHNPKDTETYIKSKANTRGFNLLHLNGMYDLCNKLYLDACVQTRKKQNEHAALTSMVDRSLLKGKAIVICDRGLESYNNFAHIEEKGWKYLIRVKNPSSNGILSGLNLPCSEEFDQKVNLILTRKHTKKEKAQPQIYKYIPTRANFDYFDLFNSKYYPLSFRVVRVKIADNSYQSFITNLSHSEFSIAMIKELYHLRWGIETSFRELKYAIGLTSYHAKKVEYIIQEVFARLIMYNFCEIITLQTVIKQNSRKHTYQVNFTRAMQICMHFFRCNNNAHPPDVEALMQKYILPIREGRKYPRKSKRKKSVSFNYRVA